MPIFWTEKEHEFIKKLNDELIGKVISQKIIYFKIKNTTEANIYGESKNKILSEGIEIDALVNIQDKVEQTNRTIGYDTKYTLEVFFQKDNIIEKNAEVAPGDYIKYGNIMYEITSCTETKFVFGMPTKSIMIRCDCVSIRESVR